MTHDATHAADASAGTSLAGASTPPAPATPPPGPLDAPGRSLWIRAVSALIFASRWLQAPLYLGLIVAQLVYVAVFLVELWHLVEEVLIHFQFTEADVMLTVLGLIDVVMVANLLIMVIIGGYETFVSRINLDGHPDEPEWLSHVNANVLKTKLAMSIIGISSIHLLKTFIGVATLGGANDTGAYTWDGVFWQVMIHLTFIASAAALAWIDKIGRDAH